MANFILQRKKQSKLQSLNDHIQSSTSNGGYDPEKVVKTEKELKNFIRPRMRGDIRGVLAPSGAGKTTWCLNDILDVFLATDSGLIALFALEQSVGEIVEKWMKMVGDTPELAERLYVFSNFDEEENMSLTDIEMKIVELEEVSGEKVIAIYVDHLHILRHNGTDFNPVMQDMKTLAKKRDVHVTVVSQTQKANQIIDLPVPRTGCYNCSMFEWICTEIVSIFQPLKRVVSESGLEVLGYQFVKIRYKNKGDRIKENMNYLYMYDHDTELLTELNHDQKAKFAMWYDKVIELRQNEEKFKSFQFDLSYTVKGTDGKEVKIDKIVGGEAGRED